jgi:methylmalonyl-CoA mutase
MSTLFEETLNLSEFPSASFADWQTAAEATLKGKPLDRLTSRTPDGLNVEPIYQADNASFLPGAANDPGQFPYIRGAKATAAWETIENGEPALPAGGVRVEAAQVHENGGTAVQEVAFAWAEGLKALRELTSQGEAIDAAAGKIRFTFAAGGEFFVIMAKLRAARYGWARIVTACGGSAEAARMVAHARTAGWELSALDVHTNILRSTTAAYAAVLGGCDSLSVLPFDQVVREPDVLSRRLAVNTQRILREECLGEAVADPAGGSWFVESLTKEIAVAAWTEFQKGESPDVTSSAQTQHGEISRRRRVMVGVNQYANPTEKPLASTAKPVTARLGGVFEPLRSASWSYAERSGSAPKIFLLTMGSLKQHKARADFSRGFLEPGGFEVVYPEGFSSVAEAVAAAKSSGALAAVLCSTDDNYLELVPDVLGQMDGAMPVILAGYPAEHIEAFQNAGIADFIHLKADCGKFLAAWQQKLGVVS